MRAMRNKKDRKPPRADISPGDRALRAAKSRVEGLCWQRAKGVDAVRKQYHDALEPLMQLAEANPDRHYGAELLNTFLPMIAAYGEPEVILYYARKHVSLLKGSTAPARRAKKKKAASQRAEEDDAVWAEIKESGLKLAHSEECARQIEPGVTKRLGRRLSLRTLTRILGRLKKIMSL
jgi:hypothetical protein